MTLRSKDSVEKRERARTSAARSRAMLDSTARADQLFRDLSDELRTLAKLYEEDDQPAYEVDKIEFLRKMLWTVYTGQPNLLAERTRWQSAHREREQMLLRMLEQERYNP